MAKRLHNLDGDDSDGDDDGDDDENSDESCNSSHIQKRTVTYCRDYYQT